MSKKNDMSDTNNTQTTSAAHQGYIERPSATERVDSEIVKALTQPSHQEEEETAGEGFTYPERTMDPYRASFGTIGRSKTERKKFWNDVETSERRNGRVQSRIIAELPYELGLAQRCMLARDFCQVFEERRLPYWAALHAPGPRNDQRNYHLHITYFDRPSGRNETGIWGHAVTERRQKKSRHFYDARPFQKKKHPDTRRIDWPKELRVTFADTCNYHLSSAGHDKRYDPRSYRDAGLEKEPTEHLGSKMSALENMGLDTTPGERNAKREIRWMISRAEEPWSNRARQLTGSAAYIHDRPTEQQSILIGLAETGISEARKSASLFVMSNMITHRADQRSSFLDTEIQRLASKDDISDLARRSSLVVALSAERDLLEENLPALQIASRKCRDLGSVYRSKNKKKLSKFDTAFAIFDPEAVFGNGMDEVLEDIEDVIADKEDDKEDDNILGDGDIQAINELFGDTVPATHSKDREDAHPGQPDHGKAMTGKIAEKVSSSGRIEPVDRISDVIRLLSSEEHHAAVRSDRIYQTEAFPGAWSIQPTKDRSEVVEIDRKLALLDNRSLRNAAIASRDATDLSSEISERQNFGRGWAVLRHEADRRGLDLDTGIHTPEHATDPDRSGLHLDHDPCSIRDVRKNIARQRVRT